ncbi:MAG: alpha/beta hydrolase [Pseudomonadota bacterium]
MTFKIVRSLAIVCVVVYLTTTLGLYVLQRQMMYFPTHANPSPSSVGLSDVSVERLTTSDGERLVLWHAPAADNQPTILFFHGNGGEMAHRADRFAAYRSAGFGVAFLSWRGYGGSTGAPSEGGLLIDARTAFEWLITQGNPAKDIAVVGESLGTGLAVRIAADNPVGALVLGAPFTATVDIAADRFPWIPVSLLMKDQFRSVDYIGTVQAPLFILHGSDDRVVPYKFGKGLYEAAASQAIFETLPNEGHQALYAPTTWNKEIEFLKRVF